MRIKYNHLSKISSGLLLSSAAAGVSAQTTAAKQHAESTTPNVIFILCDDLGFSDIEAYGNQHISTPNLTRMSKEGMSFTQFYAGTAVSAPSRASLMTGQHTGHTKIRGNKEINPEGQEPLDTTVKIIPQLFKKAGYTTGAFGKWGLGYPGSAAEPMKVGFDRFYGYNCQRVAHSYYPTALWDNASKITLDGKTYSQDMIHQQALKFIRDNKDKPFFGYFAYTLPHAGLEQPNDSILKRYNGKFYEPNSFSYNGDYAGTSIPRAQFAGMVTRLDAYVGEVLAELEKQGILENTMVIFTSDNGPHTEGGADPTFFNTEKRLRGVKTNLYEGGMREPFVVYWKGHVTAGTTSNHISTGYDMMATFTDLLGLQSAWTQPTDGISMLPTLLGHDTQQEHECVYFEIFHSYGNHQAVRKGNWKLLRLNITSTNLNKYELYDLDNDMAEKTDLSAKYPEKVAELKALMNANHVPSTISSFRFAGE